MDSNTKLETVHIVGNFLNQSVKFGKNPFICYGKLQFFRIGISRRYVKILCHIHHNETGCIPDLVCKVSAGFYSFIVETHIITRRITGNQGKTQCICAILINNLQRIDTIAKGFTHLPSLGVTNQTVE